MGKKIKSTITNAGLLLKFCTLASAVFYPFNSVQGQTAERPRLLVGVTVEGLSMDYLDLLKDYFSNEGWGYVLNNAVTLTDIDYGTPMDATANNAVIHTGTSPAINGVASAGIYDVSRRRVVPTLNSDSPSSADENFSPKNLLATTISDEIRIEGDGLGFTHSIAPDASVAIVAAGHTANSAYWINDVSGKWTTSTYYQDRPVFLQYRNRMRPLSVVLDTLTWTPSIDVERYPSVSTTRKSYPFRVYFNNGNVDRYSRYKTSPAVNSEVTDVAVEYLHNLDLGQHEMPDMLNVAYTLQPYPYSNRGDEKMETMDGYLRLDNDLKRLFKAIDEGPGRANTLLFIVGTPVNPVSRNEEEKWRIPTGSFSPRKAISLLNLYLINKFGNGEWISGFHNNFFYLNPSVLSEHNVNTADVRKEAATFLRRMEGVSQAYSIDDIIDGRVPDNGSAFARNVNPQSTGDIYINLAPGWKITDDFQTVATPAASAVNTTAPAFILYPPLETNVITESIDARRIAPTIAGLMKIRPPNGAMLPPLRLNTKR